MRRHSFPLALPISLVGGLATVFVVTALSARDELGSITTGLALTAAFAAVVSPLQDHMRRLGHLSDASWIAAAMSGCQFVAVVGSLGAFHYVVGIPYLAPFGSLALANVISIACGSILGRHLGGARGEPITIRKLVEIGGWLLLSGLTAGAAGVITSALVKSVVGSEALGGYEAARVVARPMQVMSLGIAVVLGPRSMEAASKATMGAAVAIRRLSIGLSLAAGGIYAAALGPQWPFNFVATALPNAYLLGAMVGAMVVFNTIQSVTYPYRAELLGARRQRALAQAEAGVNALFVVITAAAIPLVGAYAIPLAGIISSGGRWIWYRQLAARIYR